MRFPKSAVRRLKEAVFPGCEVNLGHSAKTRDIKWVSGSQAVNINKSLPGRWRAPLGSVQGHTEHKQSVAWSEESLCQFGLLKIQANCLT